MDRGRQTLVRSFTLLDRQLAENPFVAGTAFTIANITGFLTIEFAKRADVQLPERGADHLLRWDGQISARPSASA